jgi:hypothetical protein
MMVGGGMMRGTGKKSMRLVSSSNTFAEKRKFSSNFQSKVRVQLSSPSETPSLTVLEGEIRLT